MTALTTHPRITRLLSYYTELVFKKITSYEVYIAYLNKLMLKIHVYVTNIVGVV